MKLDISAGDLYRLKKGIMRYFAAPGKLELEIAAFCEKGTSMGVVAADGPL